MESDELYYILLTGNDKSINRIIDSELDRKSAKNKCRKLNHKIKKEFDRKKVKELSMRYIPVRFDRVSKFISHE